MTNYKITQLVKTAYKNRSEIIYEISNERYARTEFERLKKDFPAEHFELFKAVYDEECLDWTGK
jgi:hypothetical protein